MSAAAHKLCLVAPPAEWISAEEAMRRTGRSDRWLRELANSGAVQSRETGVLGRNGRPLRQYLASSLPKLASEPAAALPDTGDVSSAKAASPAAPLAGLGRPIATGDATDRAALILPADQETASRRLEIIQPVLEFESRREVFADLRLADGTPVTSASRLIRYQSETTGVAVRTIKDWLSRWRRGGRPALADRPRSNKGRSRWFEDHPEAKFIAGAAYLDAAQSKFAAWDAVCRWCKERRVAPPTYETVRAWLETNDVPAPLKVWAREGDRRLNERMLPHLTRGYTDVVANSIWISDHMIHDQIVYNDIFHGDRFKQGVRLRFTCIIDFRSRRVLGYSWTLDGSSRSIASALRMAIERYGPCLVFYVDNGEDYKRVARGADYAWTRERNEQCVSDAKWLEGLGVLQRLGISVQHCLKYHPQSKHIERFFRTLHMRLDAICPNYTTGSAYTRPERTAVAAAEHAKLARIGRAEASRLMPSSEFIAMGVEWLETDYNTLHGHRGRGMDGRTPAAVFDEGYPPESRRIPDLSHLDHLFWESHERQVRRGRLVTPGVSWVPADESSTHALYFAGESKVFVHLDPHNRDRALVTDAEGRAIARVRPETYTPQSPEAQQAIADSMSQRRRLRNATADTVREIQRRAVESGYVSAATDLRQRAGLSAAVRSVLTPPPPKPKPSDDARAPATAADIAADFWRQM